MSYKVVIAHPKVDGKTISGGNRSYFCGCAENRPAYLRYLSGRCMGAYCDACWTRLIDEWLSFRFPY